MQIFPLSCIEGPKRIVPRIFSDARGAFSESYHRQRYKEMGIEADFCQDNLSSSQKGTLRGLHFQSAPGQAKLVSCLYGKIWDVVVDLRPSSKSYLQWEAVTLEGEERIQLYVPIGFAHGFCVLSEMALVHYKVSAFYAPETEKTIRWDDPNIQVVWPIQNPILSERDRTAPFLEEVLA